jgi:Amt family ammonium transporter
MMKAVMMLPHPWKLRVEAIGETGIGGLDMFDDGSDAYPAQSDEIELGGLFGKEVKVPVKA